MRTIIFSILAVVLMTACNTKTEEAKKSETAATTDLPYTLEEPYKDWQIGSPENTAIVLKMIKAWETKNIKECASYFADTSNINMDFLSVNLSQDSLTTFLEGGWANIASVKIDMQDWESVISKDQKEQWVTVWYKQTMTDNKGNKDSLNVINDAKIEDGKIAIFSEYIQHFPETKKEEKKK